MLDILSQEHDFSGSATTGEFMTLIRQLFRSLGVNPSPSVLPNVLPPPNTPWPSSGERLFLGSVLSLFDSTSYQFTQYPSLHAIKKEHLTEDQLERLGPDILPWIELNDSEQSTVIYYDDPVHQNLLWLNFPWLMRTHNTFHKPKISCRKVSIIYEVKIWQKQMSNQ